MCLKTLFLILTLLISCKSVSVSQIKHDEDRFLNSQSPSQWVVLTDAQYDGLFNRRKNKVFPSDNIMVERLQEWSDLMRSELLKTHPELSVVPRAVIKVIKSPNRDASAARQTMCVDIPLSVDSKMDGGTDYWSLDSIYWGECLPFDGDYSKKLEFVSSRAASRKNCFVEPLGKGARITPDCLPDSEKSLRDFKGMKDLSTTNFITINSGLIEQFPEDELVSIIAHESGHYYMAHPIIQNPTLYSYFYRRSDNSGLSKPKPLDRGDPLIEKANEVRKYERFRYSKVPGQTFNSMFFAFISNAAYSIASNPDPKKICLARDSKCVETCKDFINHLTATNATFGGFPTFFRQDEQSLKDYFDYESKVQACLKGVSALSQVTMLQSAIGSIFAGVTTVTAPVPLPQESAWDLMIRTNPVITKTLDPLSDKLTVLMADITAEGLGWYTTEQEADELSLDLMVRIGLDPHAAILGDIRQESLRDLEGGDKCMDAYKSKFPNPVSIHDLTDSHHGNCYRAYNLYLELQSHKDYFTKVAPKIKPKIQKEKTWDEAQRSLKD